MPRCAECGDDLFRPIVAWGRLFCERSCAYHFQTSHPGVVAAYDRAFPLSSGKSR